MRRPRLLAAAAVALTTMTAGWAALTLPNANADTTTTGATTAEITAAEITATDATTLAAPAGSPVAANGQLHVCGVNLCNEAKAPVQLRGMGSHGLQFFPKCLNEASLTALRKDWKADLIRVAMYVQEGGYETDPAGSTKRVNDAVEMATELGLYVIVDFHVHDPGDPNLNLANAEKFFADIASTHADKPNIIYEIANEPNGVTWDEIKSYADKVIPVIRAADPDGVVIVGTPDYSSLGVTGGSDESVIVDNPITDKNTMYAFHFYAATHTDVYRNALARAAKILPLFVTEFGTQTFTGDGDHDLDSATIWLDMLDDLKISYAMWSYSDGDASNSVFVPGTCDGTDYSSSEVVRANGDFIRERFVLGRK